MNGDFVYVQLDDSLISYPYSTLLLLTLSLVCVFSYTEKNFRGPVECKKVSMAELNWETPIYREAVLDDYDRRQMVCTESVSSLAVCNEILIKGTAGRPESRAS
jgi:hypothetical protein